MKSEEPPVSDLSFAKSPSQDSPSFKVLVVEDDLCLKAAVSRVLNSIDNRLSLIWVTTGQEALDTLDSHSFDFVIADYLLPDFETGLGIWEKCRKTFQKCPSPDVQHPCETFLDLTMGRKICPSFLPKPFWPGELKRQ